jgi:hypothetical protein
MRSLARRQCFNVVATQQRHRKRLDRPVDEGRNTDAAPVLADLAERAKVDLQQHRHNHEPDEDSDRQIDLRNLATAPKKPGMTWPSTTPAENHDQDARLIRKWIMCIRTPLMPLKLAKRPQSCALKAAILGQ